ncbi:Tripartite motif-containing protein 36 [Mycobacteroides abscessus subsp. abscessus]|nr:Tripartite motif-containing protein 36 [Mycobacteroides abscessus subsp. abscessus]
MSAAPLILGALDQCADANLQRIGDVEQALIKQAPSAVFNIDQDIARHTRAQRQLFLGQPLPQPARTNPAADIGTDLLPPSYTGRVVLARSGGHAPQ